MILVDAHVHVYRAYDRAAFLEGAAGHFARNGGNGGVLLLAERSAEDAFNEFAPLSRVGEWNVSATRERESLKLTRDAKTLYLIAGRQIATAEGLEVLSLTSTQRVPDGLPARETLYRVLEGDAIAVLPWGVGKWSGQRGEIVSRLIDGPLGSRTFVGDNGGRLRGSATPALLARAIEKRRWMLPGTDPLPLAREEMRAGSYGLVLDEPINLKERPAEAIRQALRGLTAQPRVYGNLTSPLRFLCNQAHMQLRKRLRGKPLAA